MQAKGGDAEVRFRYAVRVDGRASTRELRAQRGGNAISRVEIEHARATFRHASGAETVLPYVRREVREAFEGGRSLGATETAWEREFDAAGLPKRVLATATTGVGAFGPRPAAWGRAPAYAFASTLRRSTTATALRSRPEKWLVGFACEVAHRQHGAGGSPLRTQWTAFEPHGDTLLAATATRFASAPAAGCASEAAGASEPGLELRAEFGYDARGNPTGAAVSGFRGHVPERRTSAGGFDRGRWPRRLANAAGHAEARTWDPRFGLPTSATDANGRTAAGAYDPFGRQVLRETADGAKTRTAYEWCGACGKPFGVDVSVSWIPTWTFDGFGGGGSERPSSMWGGAWSVAWTPVVTWDLWGLYYEATAHGAAERQPADEPMVHTGPILEPIGRNIYTGGGLPIGYHRYEITSDPVCDASCTHKEVVDALNRVGVHPHQEVPYVPGDRKQRDVNLPISPFRDLISTEWIRVDGVQIGVFNRTVPWRHPLHLGVVQRTVVFDGESYRILTIGAGIGLFGQFNNWFAGHGLWNEGWNEVDQKVRDLLAR